jgi:hypothetical protein
VTSLTRFSADLAGREMTTKVSFLHHWLVRPTTILRLIKDRRERIVQAEVSVGHLAVTVVAQDLETTAHGFPVFEIRYHHSYYTGQAR